MFYTHPSATILAERMQALFARDPNDPLAILADAALAYTSTQAHEARCIDAAIMALDALTAQ